MRGATKLRAQAPKLVSSGHRVVAVHDRDHVHEFVEMSHAACRVQLVTALAEGCERTRLRVVLLDRNLETLFETLRARQVSLARTDEWQSVIAKKDLNLRDRILLRATHAEHKTLRTQIREAMPSFDYFVRTLCELLPW